MSREIEWNSAGAYRRGMTETKSGKRAMITEVQRTSGAHSLYSLFIEGDKTNATNRATLERVNQILESR